MEVIAFIGPPGTGKSDRALVIAYENHASCIIDDGILIHHNRIVAGKSAKKEESRIAAVRRAIFQDPEQVADVRAALKQIRPKRLLILGTSDRMILRITNALDLPKPKRYIHIEEVARPEEIRKASEARHKEGKHVIPVPTMELRKHFRGYLVDSLNFFRYRKKGKMGKKLAKAEKSVVRPVFSYYGKLVFADRVFFELVHYSLRDMRGKIKVTRVRSQKSDKQNNGLILRLDAIVRSKGPEDMKKIIHGVRDRIQKEVEYTTGMAVETIKISILTTIH
jgi:hypothetical protein